MEQCGVIDSTMDENSKIAAFANLQFQNFNFLVWSKEKISNDSSDEELLQRFKKRFEKSLPLQSINLIYVNGLEE